MTGEPSFNDLRMAQMQQLQAQTPPLQYYDVPSVKTEVKFLEQLSPKDMNEIIEQRIRKRYWSEADKKWVAILGAKQITEEGISSIMSKCWSIINESTVYGNLPEDIIYNLTISFSQVLGRDLAINYKKYNMDLLEINTITHLCTDMAFICLKRGDSALTLRLLRTMIESKELSTQMQQGQEKNFSLLHPSTWIKK
jgi:hypothetical protein